MTRLFESSFARESILDEKNILDLSPHQVRQAETQKTAADGAVTARLPETYQWLLVPTQTNPQSPVTWQTIRLSGNDALAERASKKLKSDELLVVNFAASRLRMEMDRVPLWRGNHVSIRQIVEDFACYPYLPRLQTMTVLLNAVRAGLALLTWERDGFAYAEDYDEFATRYRGLRSGAQVSITADDLGLLVRPEVARQQIDKETAPPVPVGPDTGDGASPGPGPVSPVPVPPGPVPQAKPRRYHGTVVLDRRGSDAMPAKSRMRL